MVLWNVFLSYGVVGCIPIMVLWNVFLSYYNRLFLRILKFDYFKINNSYF